MLDISILTHEKTVATSQATSVTIPTVEGELTILPGHINLFTKLATGQLTVRNQDKVDYLAVMGGFVDIGPSHIKILAETAIRAEDINELKAKQAQEAAQKAMEEQSTEQDYLQARIDLQRAMLQLETSQKWKKLRGTA